MSRPVNRAGARPAPNQAAARDRGAGAATDLLCLAHLPAENQSARWRVVQYFPYLRSRGIHPTFWPSVPSELHAIKGEDGFLATDERQWEEKLRALIRDSALRRRVGAKARRTMESRYSIPVTGPRLADIIEQVAGS